MGNTISSQDAFENNICLICWENIDVQRLFQYCKCTRCNILLHNTCEAIWRNTKRYCECPHCRRIGTLGSYINHVS